MTSDVTFGAESITLNWVQTGPEDAPVVVLVHAVGWDLTYWDRQIEALSSDFRVVALDLPGHGLSAGRAQDWSFEYGVAAVAGVIEAAGGAPVHLAGISFGSFIALSTALARPGLVRSLTLIGSAAGFSEAVRAGMRGRAESARNGGMATVLPASLDRWFAPQTRARRPDLIDRVSKTVLADDAAVHAAIWDTIAGFEVHDRLGEIACPTLVLVGESDPSTPPTAAAELAAGIAGARLVVVPGASHMVTVERPEAVNAELRSFFSAA